MESKLVIGYAVYIDDNFVDVGNSFDAAVLLAEQYINDLNQPAALVAIS